MIQLSTKDFRNVRGGTGIINGPGVPERDQSQQVSFEVPSLPKL
ncbi:hypothetical protein [Pseudoalteromonas luteoviolacea]|uniref:Uncharacterized protein n=1 Tax=Pseudoalteromonas luteoviolacea S4054 TaxID=1129367 RepID=A0A0F6AHL0_9GAMM|nr:hypothetical protein [Pseudoalteromonas luteoviolacea]KKE84859.1 hypothetical protein N479_07115 [Pseudoalteromonas luteoviolacea S4054]KZN72476.1 hypothetical protein N481_14705 [Pseudoalteromonas luteoviolacea S4047-1]